MADKLDRLIAEQHRRIVGAENKRTPVMSGVVVEVDSEGLTCTVQLTADAEDTPTDGILLNVILENVNGMYMLPVVNANCVVAEVDGPGQLMQLLWADSYTEVSITATSKVIVKDGNGGVLTLTSGKLQFKNNSGSLFNVLQTHIQNLQTHVLNIDALTVDTAVGPSGVPENIAEFAQDYSNFGQDLNALSEILF